ncbi:MAG: hypothetical protein HYY52_07220 [Candidatus Melainabacteria bacterium]|nr:hypothetical protein [Candidatus Melainabacteria bacterium]
MSVIQDLELKESKLLPIFIVIERSNEKKIKIPCSNEVVAKKVLASFAGLKTNIPEPSYQLQ